MSSILVHLYNLVSAVLPSKFYSIRRRLLIFAGCTIGKSVSLNHNVKVYGNALIVGDSTWISLDTIISSSYNKEEVVDIGKNCDIGPQVLFITGTHKIGNQERRAGEGICLPIRIGDGTWIGAKATILGGAKVGKGSLIAAGSVVLPGIYPDNSLLVGVPAVVKKEL